MRLGRFLGAFGVAAVGVLGLALPASAKTVGGTEHFLLLQTGINAPTSLSAVGPIHAAGEDVMVTPTTDRFVFPKGTLRVLHHATSSQNSFDPKTCVARQSQTGTVDIAGGTGAYAHASGHGTYFFKLLVVGCSHKAPPVQFLLRINATSTISF